MPVQLFSCLFLHWSLHPPALHVRVRCGGRRHPSLLRYSGKSPHVATKHAFERKGQDPQNHPGNTRYVQCLSLMMRKTPLRGNAVRSRGGSRGCPAQWPTSPISQPLHCFRSSPRSRRREEVSTMCELLLDSLRKSKYCTDGKSRPKGAQECRN